MGTGAEGGGERRGNRQKLKAEGAGDGGGREGWGGGRYGGA